MRTFHTKLPIYIFALALTCGGLFFAPAGTSAAETPSIEVSQIDNTSTETVTDPTTASTAANTTAANTNTTAANTATNTTTANTNTTTVNKTSSSTSSSQKKSSQKSKKASSKKSDKTNLKRWLEVCETMGKNLRKKDFTYSNHGTRSTYKGALSSGKKSNCALYVSWCLQEYGALKKGKTFYVRHSGSLKKNFSKWGKKVKVIRVNKSCSSANLKPGDVVCWSGIAHCNIYAGRNKSRERIWYDAGKSATYSGHSGSHYENVGTKTQGYLSSKRVSYIIRIKDL